MRKVKTQNCPYNIKKEQSQHTYTAEQQHFLPSYGREDNVVILAKCLTSRKIEQNTGFFLLSESTASMKIL